MKAKFKAMLLGIGVVLSVELLSSSADAHVLDGAKEYNNHYYKIMNIRMKWDEVDSFYKSTGGHLATAESADENEMLKNGHGLRHFRPFWDWCLSDRQKPLEMGHREDLWKLDRIYRYAEFCTVILIGFSMGDSRERRKSNAFNQDSANVVVISGAGLRRQ